MHGRPDAPDHSDRPGELFTGVIFHETDLQHKPRVSMMPRPQSPRTNSARRRAQAPHSAQNAAHLGANHLVSWCGLDGVVVVSEVDFDACALDGRCWS